MPEDIRKDRPDCPGELDGICVKMMQKDPKFRYQDCNQVAAALENWLQKYKAENPDVATKPARGMTLDDLLEGAKSKDIYSSETVNNQLDDTKIESNRKSAQAGQVLSSSDSGVLRAIVKSDASSVDSRIDLIHDSSQPNQTKSKSQAIQQASGKSHPSSSDPSPLTQPIERKTTDGKASSKPATSPTAKTTGSQTKLPSPPKKQPQAQQSHQSRDDQDDQDDQDDSDQGSKGLPWWAWTLILLVALLALGGFIAAVVFLKP
jgi:serine/threonine-protein kinase